MQKQIKKISVMAVIIICLLISAACQQNAVLKTSPGADEQTGEAAQESAAATDAGETASETPPVSTEAAADIKPAESFLEVSETGADPNPDSVFAKLSMEEKEALIEWLNGVSASFGTAGEQMNGFIRNDAVNTALNEGKKLAEIPEYIRMRDSVLAELDKVDALDTSSLPQSAAGLQESSASYVQWCRGFFPQLENQSAADPASLSSWIDGQLRDAIPFIQKFLDELQRINS